jgi:eukaryotic-like serine/threonine-protein kinase
VAGGRREKHGEKRRAGAGGRRSAACTAIGMPGFADLAGIVIDDRFELHELAGRGGMGTVFRATDRRRRDAVAIKVLHHEDPRTAARLESEVRALEQLDHPTIVKVLGHGTTASGQPYLVMPWLEGETLADRLRTRGPLETVDATAIVSKLAEALGHAHERGVVHRDVKPANVLLAARPRSPEAPGTVYLLDFGLARSFGRGSTRSGLIAGTAPYLAPEQARGERELDARADVFALGCLFYECLAGRSPFEADSVTAALAKVLFEQPIDLELVQPAVPEKVARLVARMLAKDPTRRPVNGRAVAAALEGAGPSSREPVDAVITASESWLGIAVFVGGNVLPRPVTDTIDEPPPPSEPRIDDARSSSSVLSEIRQIALGHGGRVESLFDGSVLVAPLGGDAREQALRAAECALSIQAASPGLSLDIRMIGSRTTSRGRAASGRGIRIDETVAGLLGDRFVVERIDSGEARLEGERAASLPALAVRRDLPFVGRELEQDLITDLLERCVERGGARAVLVSGPAGIGKSRLCEEIRRSVDAVRVIASRADPITTGAPLAMVAQVAALLAPNAAPELSFGDEQRGEDPATIRERLAAAFLEVIAGALAGGPVALLLEDVHLCDASSIAFFARALRRFRERRFFLLMTSRPMAPASEVLTEVEQMASVKVTLAPLGEAAMTRLARESLALRGTGPASAATPTLSEIVRLSDGNPFFLEELVRAFALGQRHTYPAGLLASVQTRLRELDPAVRRVLRAASIFGETFSLEGIGALTGSPRAHIDRSIGILVGQEIVEPPGPSRIARFRHALLREGAYSLLTPEDERLGHLLAARWLVSSGANEPLAIAEHFVRAGEPVTAAPFWSTTARRALVAGDYRGAERHALAGLADPGIPRDLQGELAVVHALACKFLGRNEEAAEISALAAELLERGRASWFEAIGTAGACSGRLGRSEVLSAWSRCLHEPPRDELARRKRAQQLTGVATYFPIHGRTDEAEVLVRLEAPALLGAMGRTIEILIALARQDVAQACVHGRDAVALARAEDDPASAPQVFALAAMALTAAGAFEEADAWTKEALAMLPPSAPHQEVTILTVTATAALGRGRAEEARDLATRARASALAQKNPRLVGIAQLTLAEALASLGLASAALVEIESTLKDAFPPCRVLALAMQAALTEDAASAVRVAGQARTALEEVGTFESRPLLVHAVWAETLERAGHRREARTVFEQTEESLFAIATGFATDIERDLFLGAPLSRRITGGAARARRREDRS